MGKIRETRIYRMVKECLFSTINLKIFKQHKQVTALKNRLKYRDSKIFSEKTLRS
jgi:hypothetical protein